MDRAPYVDIPNLRNKLVSHPSITDEGTLYFHASDLDYTNMEIYFARWNDGAYQEAEKVELNIETTTGTCTPYISPGEHFIIFATIGPLQLDLNISWRQIDGTWSLPQQLPKEINHKGQGNPWVSLDGNFLFYSRIKDESKNIWEIDWVKTNEFIYPKTGTSLNLNKNFFDKKGHLKFDSITVMEYVDLLIINDLTPGVNYLLITQGKAPLDWIKMEDIHNLIKFIDSQQPVYCVMRKISSQLPLGETSNLGEQIMELIDSYRLDQSYPNFLTRCAMTDSERKKAIMNWYDNINK